MKHWYIARRYQVELRLAFLTGLALGLILAFGMMAFVGLTSR